MRREIARILVPRALAVIIAATGVACGSSPITSARIEPAIETTFANLVELQLTRLGLPLMRAADLDVSAVCRRLVPGKDAGSGEWGCTLVWQGLERRTVRDAYDVFVATDGCYTATVDGDTLGDPILRAEDGRSVKNLLYAFEGCFNTSP